MSVATVVDTEAGDIIREGWKLLVEKLGLQRATQFIVLLERGKGDSVEEIAKYWADSTIDDIYSRISAWKKEQ